MKRMIVNKGKVIFFAIIMIAGLIYLIILAQVKPQKDQEAQKPSKMEEPLTKKKDALDDLKMRYEKQRKVYDSLSDTIRVKKK